MSFTKNNLLTQFLPLILTVVTFFVLCGVLFCFISLLNLFPLTDKILIHLHIADVLVGLTIYLKTSVDFAIFIGNLMKTYLGWKNRIAIELGTAVGNALGTCFVLLIWTFFKEVPVLMIIMILLASLVLFRLAEEGLEGLTWREMEPLRAFLTILKKINALFYPVIRFIIPRANTSSSTRKTFLSLTIFAFTVPLVLGLDDFAGYIPLFNIINVFGFAVGVFLGHMLLNVALFASPSRTIALVKKPLIELLGSLAFIGIALWGFFEVLQIVKTFFH